MSCNRREPTANSGSAAAITVTNDTAIEAPNAKQATPVRKGRATPNGKKSQNSFLEARPSNFREDCRQFDVRTMFFIACTRPGQARHPIFVRQGGDLQRAARNFVRRSYGRHGQGALQSGVSLYPPIECLPRRITGKDTCFTSWVLAAHQPWRYRENIRRRQSTSHTFQEHGRSWPDHKCPSFGCRHVPISAPSG